MKVRSSFVPGQELPRLAIERKLIYVPGETWTYAHHAQIMVFKGRIYAMWSNGRRNEDDTDQRVMLSCTHDFFDWPAPEIFAKPDPGGVLSPGGFHAHDGSLVAYYCDLGEGLRDPHLHARITSDGLDWEDASPLGIRTCANHSPRPTASGRLLMAAQLDYPFTDHPDGLSGWKMAGTICPNGEALCESAFFQTDDGVIHMLLRNFGKGIPGKGYQGKLWITESMDDAESWTTPVEADFSDNNQKFHSAACRTVAYITLAPRTQNPFCAASGPGDGSYFLSLTTVTFSMTII